MVVDYHAHSVAISSILVSLAAHRLMKYKSSFSSRPTGRVGSRTTTEARHAIPAATSFGWNPYGAERPAPPRGPARLPATIEPTEFLGTAILGRMGTGT